VYGRDWWIDYSGLRLVDSEMERNNKKVVRKEERKQEGSKSVREIERNRQTKEKGRERKRKIIIRFVVMCHRA
jgi:hypothetical protein